MIYPVAMWMIAVSYRPFLDPLPVWQDSRWPFLLLPLSLGVAIVYKSIRCANMRRVPREALSLTITIVVVMVVAAAALALIVRGLER